MFSQNFSRTLTGLCASFLLLAASPLLASLVVNINQTNPVGPACVEVGNNVTYAITVTNSGPGSVRCITLNDTVTSNTTGAAGICLVSVSSCSPDCEQFVITPSSNGFNVTTTEKLGCNQSFVLTATYKVCTSLDQTLLPPSATLTNLVTVSGIDSHGNVIDGTATELTCVQGCALAVQVVPVQADFVTNVCVDGSIVLTANVTGSCEDQNSLTYMWTTSTGVVPTPGPNANQVTISGPSLPVCGLTLPLTATVVVTDNFTGCTATATSGAICSVTCADLAIEKTAKVCGNQITYTVTVINNGPSLASGPIVTDCLPAGLTILSITPDKNPWGVFTVTNNCIIGQFTDPAFSIPAGGSASFVVVAQITGHCPKTICNTATVTSSTFDPNLSNNSATVRVHKKKH